MFRFGDGAVRPVAAVLCGLWPRCCAACGRGTIGRTSSKATALEPVLCRPRKQCRITGQTGRGIAATRTGVGCGVLVTSEAYGGPAHPSERSVRAAKAEADGSQDDSIRGSHRCSHSLLLHSPQLFQQLPGFVDDVREVWVPVGAEQFCGHSAGLEKLPCFQVGSGQVEVTLGVFTP
jgi:hypothetical protein